MIHKYRTEKKALCGLEHDDDFILFYWDEVTCPHCLYHHPNNIKNRLHDIAINQAIQSGYQLAIDTLKRENCIQEAQLLESFKETILE